MLEDLLLHYKSSTHSQVNGIQLCPTKEPSAKCKYIQKGLVLGRGSLFTTKILVVLLIIITTNVYFTTQAFAASAISNKLDYYYYYLNNDLLVPSTTSNLPSIHNLRLKFQKKAGLLKIDVKKVIRATSSYANAQPLAVKPHRIDPLNHFHKYRGGFDLQGKHYMASTLFTGIPGFVIGVVWIMIGFVICSHRVLTRSSRIARRHRKMMVMYIWEPSSPPTLSCKLSHNPTSTFYKRVNSKLVMIPLLILTTLLTTFIIACCGVIFAENQLFYNKAKEVESTIVVEGAQRATELIYNVTDMMAKVKVDIEPYDKSVAGKLNSTTKKLNDASNTLVNVVDHHKSSMDLALKTMDVGIHIIAALNIVLWSFGLACGYLFPRTKHIFLVVIILAWLLVFLNWVTFGFSFVIRNFADDMCDALKEYRETSRNTTLDNVLPCNQLAAGNTTIFKLRQKIYDYIEEANTNITKLNFPHEPNQEVKVSGIPQVCNPFSGPPSYGATDNCRDGTIAISILPELLASFKCPNASTSTNSSHMMCIPVKQYNIASAYIYATEKLLTSLPEIENLTDCSFVNDTFDIIVTHQCKPLKHAIKVLWITLVILSSLSTTTMLLWLLRFSIGRRIGMSSLLQDRHS